MTVVIDEGRFAPEQIRFHQFRVARRGFDPDEVAAFLGDLAEHVVELETQIVEARQREEATKAVAQILHEENEILKAKEQPAPSGGPQLISGAEAQMLVNVEVRAAEIIAEAQNEARRIVAGARRRAQGMHQQAEAFLQAAGATDSASQALALLGMNGGGTMADTLTERAELILEAEQRVQDARDQLLDEAEQVTAAAEQVLTRFSVSDRQEPDVIDVEVDDTEPVELFDQED